MTQLKRIKIKLGLDPEKGRTSSELRREEKEMESLLTVEEWYQTFVTTCKGMFSLGPSNYNTIVHLIYCACVARKFSTSEVNKVESSLRSCYVIYRALFIVQRFLFFCVSIAMLIQDYSTAFLVLKILGNTVSGLIDSSCVTVSTLRTFLFNFFLVSRLQTRMEYYEHATSRY